MAGESKLTEDQRAEIIKLREEKKISYNALAAQFGVSSNTIIRICRPEYYEQHKKASREYQKGNSKISQYRKENYKNFSLGFHIANDADVIEFLSEQENIQNYVRQKVREDINKRNKKGSENK